MERPLLARTVVAAVAVIVGTLSVISAATGTRHQAPARRIGLTPDQFVEARQTGMDLSATTLLALKSAVTAEREPKTQVDNAGNLNRWANALTMFFPEGTAAGAVKAKTAAKATVFSDRAGFLKAASDYQVAAAELVSRAKANDIVGFKEQLSRVSETCTQCHSIYKEREE
jgi:cytochrome c556